MKITHPTFKAFFQEILDTDLAMRQEYEKPDLAFEIAKMMIDARIIKGITQSELAKKAKTSQSSIARVESGSYLPSLSFLQNIAQAMNTYLKPPKFGFMENKTGSQYYEQEPYEAQGFGSRPPYNITFGSTSTETQKEWLANAEVTV